jgi:hypothetical protein
LTPHSSADLAVRASAGEPDYDHQLKLIWDATYVRETANDAHKQLGMYVRSLYKQRQTHGFKNEQVGHK